MPSDSDHIRRDAQHAARSEIRIIAAKYIRRMDAEAKANIDVALAARAGQEVDGTDLGRACAREAVASWLDSEPKPAIEAAAVEADPDPA